jgi:hypothetical protein
VSGRRKAPTSIEDERLRRRLFELYDRDELEILASVPQEHVAQAIRVLRAFCKYMAVDSAEPKPALRLVTT